MPEPVRLRIVSDPSTDLAKLMAGARRGYCFVYRRNEVNRCPGCGRSQWIVGRFSAECAFCATALMFQEGGR